MKYLLITLLLACSISTQAQVLDDAYSAYNDKDYKRTLNITALLMKDGSAADLCALRGRVYADMDVYDSAIFYLQKALVLDGDASWLSAWSHAYLGKVYIATGNKQAGVVQLMATVKMNKTKNATDYAMKMLDYVQLIPEWVVIKDKNINYYFQDTVGWGASVQQYITQHEAAFEQLNKVFKAVMPRKPVLYIWNDTAQAAKVLKRPLGYTNAELCVSHVQRNESVGHELTHVLSYWSMGTKPVQQTRFINEGLSVAFDLSGRDLMAMAKAATHTTTEHSILNIWRDNKLSGETLYPIAGAFVSYLYEHSTTKEFDALIKDQTPEAAEKIYGKKQFDKIVGKFDRMMGLQ